MVHFISYEWPPLNWSYRFAIRFINANEETVGLLHVASCTLQATSCTLQDVSYTVHVASYKL